MSVACQNLRERLISKSRGRSTIFNARTKQLSFHLVGLTENEEFEHRLESIALNYLALFSSTARFHALSIHPPIILARRESALVGLLL